ncbi:MAG: hypothetical protein IT368_09220 [Candidatus Hydrogenedentes bacterium]|nr:hypothetical protein [Candidatus Hydrogenedentota bacterium]
MIGIGITEMLIVGFICTVILFMFASLAFGARLAVRVLGSSGTPDADREEEVRLMQELYQGMKRLESRVESLETILLEREAEMKEMHR